MKRITREEVYQAMGLEHPTDFKYKRELENFSDKGLEAECYGERQTGRSTRLMIDVCVHIMNNHLRTIDRTIIVVCHNHNSLYLHKNKLQDILKKMKWDFSSTWDMIRRDGKVVVEFVTPSKMAAVDFLHSRNVNHINFVFDPALNDMIGV